MSTTAPETQQSEIPAAFYLPWTDGENNFEEGIEFGKGLAQTTGLQLQVGMPQLNQIPDELAKLPRFTERSRGLLRTSRVVLLLHPTFKLMSHGLPGNGSHTVVVEFPSNKLHGWAAFAGAFNLKLMERMSVQLNDDVQELYARIEWNGNNGWTDTPGKRDAIRDLGKLKSLGELDLDLLRGYMLPRKSETAVERLIKLADQVAKMPSR